MQKSKHQDQAGPPSDLRSQREDCQGPLEVWCTGTCWPHRARPDDRSVQEGLMGADSSVWTCFVWLVNARGFWSQCYSVESRGVLFYWMNMGRVGWGRWK